MSEHVSKKLHKKRKHKPKPKKRKPKPTKEFEETEKEITEILNNTQLTVDNIEEDPDELGIAFFCQNVENHASPKSKTPSPEVEEEEEHESEHSQETNRAKTASSFIQIEDENPIKRVQAEKLIFSENLLFSPSPTINPFIQNIQSGDPVLQPNTNLIRLVNRYQEEGNTHLLTSGSSLKNQTNFLQDDQLYATVCEKEFNPVFCVIKPGDKNDPIIPSRKLITLAIKELKFTGHPLQHDEHILANKLENVLDIYFRREENQLIDKLKTKLSDLRKSTNNVLEDGTTQDVEVLERNLSKLQQLRSDIHQEELTSKQLLRNILDTWLELKNLRKQQEFHWTSLKLKIKLTEVDLDQDAAEWTKRFETELKEVYREELEAYYRARRLRKADPVKYSTKPQKPNIEDLKTDLKKILQRCSRVPGEPVIKVIRTNLSDPCRPLEKLKSYYLRVLFDGQIVGSTRCFRLEPDLSLVFNESLGIYLDRRIPKEIKIKLYEKKKLPTMPVKIANISVPLPSLGQNQKRSETVHFSSHKKENISGRLYIDFHCDKELYSMETIFSPPNQRTQIPERMLPDSKKKQLKDFPNETQIVEDRTSDEEENEQNPEEAEESCTFEESLLEFCSREEIDNNPRLRLFSSIYRREMKIKDIRYMPHLEDALDEDQDEKVIDMGNWMDPIDIHKHNGKKYLVNLYEEVRNHCEKLAMIDGNSDELLVENSIVTLKSFFAALLTMFSPSRSLTPERTTQPLMITHENVRKFNIVVNVVRATGIPVRAFTTPSLNRRDSSSTSMYSSQTFKYSNVRPFVSATYMDKTSRTMTAEGSSPTWNEHLILQIVGNPVELKGDLKVAIFDEYVENHVSDESSMEIFQRFQSNWLGEYRIPISTILSNQRIDGVFELHSPKVLLGYSTPSLNEALTIDSNIPEVKERVNLWLYVGVEPNFLMPQSSMKNLECSELKDVRNHIQEWCFEAKDMQPNRFIDPLVCTMDGKRVCLTRLLEPIPLPMETSENILESICRYVSMLNILKSFDPCMQFGGIWLNNQTLLDTGWGSTKDLCILLTNYLLTLGIRCWVVLGIAYPHGESAYVLYEDGSDFLMLDPTTGKKYATKDSYCPMNRVSYIFSQHNIFCNIQTENRVSMMNFDVSDSACWFPMFNKRNPAPLGGVQKLNYAYKSSNNISELRKNIERKIMKKISAWRPMQKTVWNRAFQSTMLKILVDLEYESTLSPTQPESNLTERLVAELGNNKIFGFTLNFSYTNLSSISERIKSTGIHLNGDKKVEFSVAVHIHSYPFNILSVWIFLMTIVSR